MKLARQFFVVDTVNVIEIRLMATCEVTGM
jgi:hypothetical protein